MTPNAEDVARSVLNTLHADIVECIEACHRKMASKNLTALEHSLFRTLLRVSTSAQFRRLTPTPLRLLTSEEVYELTRHWARQNPSVPADALVEDTESYIRSQLLGLSDSTFKKDNHADQQTRKDCPARS